MDETNTLLRELIGEIQGLRADLTLFMSEVGADATSVITALNSTEDALVGVAGSSLTDVTDRLSDVADRISETSGQSLESLHELHMKLFDIEMAITSKG